MEKLYGYIIFLNMATGSLFVVKRFAVSHPLDSEYALCSRYFLLVLLQGEWAET